MEGRGERSDMKNGGKMGRKGRRGGGREKGREGESEGGREGGTEGERETEVGLGKIGYSPKNWCDLRHYIKHCDQHMKCYDCAWHTVIGVWNAMIGSRRTVISL